MKIGKSVKNIFDLVHHFGNEEDQVSANFGFILEINKPVLLEILNKLGIETKSLRKKDIERIEIETQVPYRTKDEISKIDLRIKLDGRFLIFVESKIWGRKIDINQAKKYAALLDSEKESFDRIRLVYITQFNQLYIAS